MATLRALLRWAVLTSLLAAILFIAAGSTEIPSLRDYVAVLSALLLFTMVAVDPELARERARPAGTRHRSRIAYRQRVFVSRDRHLCGPGCRPPPPVGQRPALLAARRDHGVCGSADSAGSGDDREPVLLARAPHSGRAWPLGDYSRAVPFPPASRLPGHAHRCSRIGARPGIVARLDSSFCLQHSDHPPHGDSRIVF